MHWKMPFVGSYQFAFFGCRDVFLCLLDTTPRRTVPRVAAESIAEGKPYLGCGIGREATTRAGTPTPVQLAVYGLGTLVS